MINRCVYKRVRFAVAYLPLWAVFQRRPDPRHGRHGASRIFVVAVGLELLAAAAAQASPARRQKGQDSAEAGGHLAGHWTVFKVTRVLIDIYRVSANKKVKNNRTGATVFLAFSGLERGATKARFFSLCFSLSVATTYFSHKVLVLFPYFNEVHGMEEEQKSF